MQLKSNQHMNRLTRGMSNNWLSCFCAHTVFPGPQCLLMVWITLLQEHGPHLLNGLQAISEASSAQARFAQDRRAGWPEVRL